MNASTGTARPDRASLAIALLSLAGLLVAGYLTYVHYAEIEPVCGGDGCERVQASEYAELAGVPVALLGLVGYAAIALSLLARGELGRTATAALALIGLGFSLYLTYVELVVIEAVCIWCVISALLMAALAAVAVARLLRATAA